MSIVKFQKKSNRSKYSHNSLHTEKKVYLLYLGENNCKSYRWKKKNQITLLSHSSVVVLPKVTPSDQNRRHQERVSETIHWPKSFSCHIIRVKFSCANISLTFIKLTQTICNLIQNIVFKGHKMQSSCQLLQSCVH